MDGSWSAGAFEATCVWRGKGELDLALLKLGADPPPHPVLPLAFASYDLAGVLGETVAVGFPTTWIAQEEAIGDYSTYGVLRVASGLGPYAWSVSPADKPDDPNGWKGFSGAALCRIAADDKLYVFGAVQEVPANFSGGLLKTARLGHAFDDTEFVCILKDALGKLPQLVMFTLGTDFQARMFKRQARAFMDEYLISEKGRPVPFGGRSAEFQRLNDWLFDPDAPQRMLVTAPAARGKSALLVHWLKSLEVGGACGTNGWQLVFCPISLRFDSSRPEIFYELLARRLADISGGDLPVDQIRGADGFRYAICDLLDRISTQSSRVLIVIDGLDEAPQGSFDPSIFPRALPENVRVLLSARWQVGDNDSKGWLERLGWDRSVSVDSWELCRLGRNEITDVLAKLGARLEVVARDSDLVKKLTDLSDGETLVVRYYAEDLWAASVKGARITRQDLDAMKPGFDGYFERWFELQKKFWQDEKIEPQVVDEVLQILAFAFGPLAETDLLTLMRRIHGTKELTPADRLLNPLRRFVIGTGDKERGFVFTHPKIAEYLQRKRFAALAGTLQKAFSDWGLDHLHELNSGAKAPQQASSYLVQFLPHHFDVSGASADDYIKFVGNGWRQAWEALEGGQHGFATAIRKARLAQDSKGPGLRLGARWRCALALASINSWGLNVRAEIVLAAVEHGALTVRQAIHFAELKGKTADGAKMLASLAVASRSTPKLSQELTLSTLSCVIYCKDSYGMSNAKLFIECLGILLSNPMYLAPIQRDATLRELLAAAETIEDEEARASALIALLPHVGTEQRECALVKASTAAGVISSERGRFKAMTDLLPHLDLHQKKRISNELLTAAKATGGEYELGNALASIFPHLTAEQKRTEASEVLVAVKAIPSEIERAMVLAALVPYLAPEQKSLAVGDALAAAKAITFDSSLSAVLSALAPHLASEQFSEALALANAIDNDLSRAPALAALVPMRDPEQRKEMIVAATANGSDLFRWLFLKAIVSYVAPDFHGELIKATKAIKDPYGRLEVLVALLTELAPDRKKEILQEAWVAARNVSHKGSRSWALVMLAPHLAPKERAGVLAEALTLAKTIDDEDLRSTVLLALVSYLGPEQRERALHELLTTATAIPNDLHRLKRLVKLAPHLVEERRDEALHAALNAAKAIGSESERFDAFKVLVPHVAPTLRESVLLQALASANAIGDAYNRSKALAALVPQLSEEQKKEALQEAIAAALAIGEGYYRSEALNALVPKLPPELRESVLLHAFAAAKTIGSDYYRSEALSLLATLAGAGEKENALVEALVAARAIEYEYDRALVLATLATHFAPDQRSELRSEALAAANARTDRLFAPARLKPERPGERPRPHSLTWSWQRRLSALIALIPHFAPEKTDYLLAETLTVARATAEDLEFSVALARLVPVLASEKEEMCDETLAAGKRAGEEFFCSESFVALVPHLTPKQSEDALREAVAAAGKITSKVGHSSAVVALLERVPTALKIQTLLTLIDVTGYTSRHHALQAVEALARVTWELGGETAVTELHHAVNDVCHWYP
jgi:hypothetical protein